jgi:transposase
VSSGGRISHRLSGRGNRQLNHATHIAAITQIRFARSPGRAFFERKVAEGKTKKEAVRALKLRISDAVYRQLVSDARTMTVSRIERWKPPISALSKSLCGAAMRGPRRLVGRG